MIARIAIASILAAALLVEQGKAWGCDIRVDCQNLALTVTTAEREQNAGRHACAYEILDAYLRVCPTSPPEDGRAVRSLMQKIAPSVVRLELRVDQAPAGTLWFVNGQSAMNRLEEGLPLYLNVGQPGVLRVVAPGRGDWHATLISGPGVEAPRKVTVEPDLKQVSPGPDTRLLRALVWASTIVGVVAASWFIGESIYAGRRYRDYERASTAALSAQARTDVQLSQTRAVLAAGVGLASGLVWVPSYLKLRRAESAPDAAVSSGDQSGRPKLVWSPATQRLD